MTTDQLRHLFNTTFGVTNEFPKTFEVNYETYANVCQSIFNNTIDKNNGPWITIAVGPISNGILFKGVELILEGQNDRKINKIT